MTQDEIIDKLLFQAGAHFGGDGINYEEFDFRKFAKLIAAKERKATIKIIKETPFSNWFQADVIEAIRARGEQA
jgi:hypothetical protein